jgi:hypothetical protein
MAVHSNQGLYIAAGFEPIQHTIGFARTTPTSAEVSARATFGREIIDFSRKNPICIMQHGEQKFMTQVRSEKPENRHVRADRIAREYISAERTAREKKTARLREMRLQMERMAA